MAASDKIDLDYLFRKVSDVLSRHSDGFSVRQKDGCIEMAGTKKVNYLNRVYDGMFFASVVRQKNFIGFYYFPVYTHPEHLDVVHDPLKKCLKGKSCFHIKKDDPLLLDQIDQLLTKGKDFYKSIGFL